MEQPTLIILLTIFVGLTAIAMVAQAIAMVGLFLVAKKVQERVLLVLPEVQMIIGVTRRSIEEVEKHIQKIGNSSSAILDVTKGQLVKVDELLNDATRRAKVQMERAEMVLDDAMTKTQETVGLVQRGVVRPIREVHGVLTGFRTALSYLGRGGRPTVDHATSDEEMFI